MKQMSMSHKPSSSYLTGLGVWICKNIRVNLSLLELCETSFCLGESLGMGPLAFSPG